MSIVRMNSEEKNTVKKKDEHDENVSLHFPLASGATPRLPDHELSPPPAKKAHETEQGTPRPSASAPLQRGSSSVNVLEQLRNAVPPQVPPKTTSVQVRSSFRCCCCCFSVILQFSQ